jgi:HCOMODA/2-hydroxy-3-carboxy-muconic semialdehyde decarboxylase
MDEVERSIGDLVIANRILAREDVLDAYGHVSIRHPLKPDRYLLSRSLSPELVTRGDIIEFMLDGSPVGDARPPYLERFIHGAIYEARPDINAVVHSHAEDVLPFGIVTTPLQPVIHSGGFMGHRAPIWDIRDKFGDTNLLVTNMEQGRDLASVLGPERVALMRGHGFAAAGLSLADVVRLAVYLPKNARVLLNALRLGAFKPLSAGEIEKRIAISPSGMETARAWEYWATRAGCASLMAKPKRTPAKRGKARPRTGRR